MLNLLTLYGMFCLSNCVPMQSALRPDVSPAASPRIASYVGTQFGGGRLIRGMFPGSLKGEKVTRHSSLFIFFRFSVVLLEAYRKKGV